MSLLVNISEQLKNYVENNQGTAVGFISSYSAPPITSKAARCNLQTLIHHVEGQDDWKAHPKLSAIHAIAKISLETDFAADKVDHTFQATLSCSDDTVSDVEKKANGHKRKRHDTHKNLDHYLAPMLKKLCQLDKEIAHKERSETISYSDYESAQVQAANIIKPFKEELTGRLKDPKATTQQKLDAAEGIVYLVNGFPLSQEVVKETEEMYKEAEAFCSQYLADNIYKMQAKRVLEWLQTERKFNLHYNATFFFSKYTAEKVVKFMRMTSQENVPNTHEELEQLLNSSIHNFQKIVQIYEESPEQEARLSCKTGLAAEYEMKADYYFHLATMNTGEEKANFLEKAANTYEEVRKLLTDPEKIKIIDLSIFNARYERAEALKLMNCKQAAITEFDLLLEDLATRLPPAKHYKTHFQIICNEIDCLTQLAELTEKPTYATRAEKRVQFYLKNRAHWPKGPGDIEEIELRMQRYSNGHQQQQAPQEASA